MPTPVVIDTDIGTDIDDTWALAMALGCPELDVKLITTCTGDTAVRAKIVCKMLEAVGAAHIPVAVGLPFEAGREMQAAWVEDYTLEQYPGEVSYDAAASIHQLLETEEELTLIAIGPLPNVADLVKRYPEDLARIRFIGMHGAVRKGYFGSETVSAEYNVKEHLDCAQVVFSSDLDMTITPLDTCGLVRLKDEHYQEVAQIQNKSMSVVLDNYRIWLTAIGKNPDIADEKSSVLFDTVAIYLAYADELLEIENLSIAVDEEGKTVISEAGKLMRVATEWRDMPAFQTHLLERLAAAP